MKYINFPNGQMPIIGLGLWQVGNDEEIDFVVETAIEAGYRHFDTATKYRNEKGLGRALKKALTAGKATRDELFIVTKLPCIGMQPDKVTKFMKASLEALQMDYVDLYLVHWPFGFQYINDDVLVPVKDGRILFDMTTNIEAIWREMEQQLTSGRTKAIGLSNFAGSQIERIANMAQIMPCCNQVELHAYFQQKELRETCANYNISLCAYGPLGSPGRNRGIGILQNKLVVELALKYRKSPGQILLRFLTQLNIPVIPKSSNPGRITENINVLDFELTSEEIADMERLDKGESGRSFLGFAGFRQHPECPF